MDSRAEYATPSQAIGGIPRKFCVVSHGSEIGSINAVPAIIVETVRWIAPYFGRRRVDSALCQPQQKAAPIMSRFPVQLPNDSESDAKSTIAAAPASDKMIPRRMPWLNR